MTNGFRRGRLPALDTLPANLTVSPAAATHASDNCPSLERGDDADVVPERAAPTTVFVKKGRIRRSPAWQPSSRSCSAEDAVSPEGFGSGTQEVLRLHEGRRDWARVVEIEGWV